MIVVVSGNPRPGSRTLSLAAEAGAQLAARLDAPAPHVVDLATLGHRVLVPGDEDRARALATVAGASLLIVATPTYKASYTGLLKVLLDAFPHGAFAGMAAAPLVTAGTAEQAARAADKLADLLGELGADPVLPSLTAIESEFGAGPDSLAALARTFVDILVATVAPAAFHGA